MVLVASFLFAAGTSDVLVAILPVLIGTGLLASVLTVKGTNRKLDAEASNLLQDTYEDAVRDLREQMAALRRDGREARAEAAEAKAHAAAAKEQAATAVLEQSRAETRAAELQALLARVEQKAGEERHAFRNELAAKAAEVAVLSRRVEELEQELVDVRARIGQPERRRKAPPGGPDSVRGDG